MLTSPNQQSASSAADPQQNETLADLYSFLALAMRYPDSSFLDQDYLRTFMMIIGQAGLMAEQDELRLIMANEENFLDSLQVEYTRLFINHIPQTIAPPYASVYMDGDYSLQGKYTEKIRDFYRGCGFDVTDNRIPPDHIQFQLAFLANLVQEDLFVQEQEFLTTLFRPWFARFLDTVFAEVEHPFYRVSLQLIDILTQEEQ